ncbi:MAG: HEAT repeat domain-containing protein [Polyangiaceae bacterium]
MRQVEEALARQVIYGGDLVTNLLEVARIDERVLTLLLAESMRLPPAPIGELPLSEAARALIPAEMAVQQSVVPVEITEEKLVVAVVEPLSQAVSDHLASSLGMRIEQLAAPSVRVWQGISRLYGVQLERRMQRLLGRLSGESIVTTSNPPPPRDSQAPAVRSPSNRTSGLGAPTRTRGTAAPFTTAPLVGQPSTTLPTGLVGASRAVGASVRPAAVRTSTLTSFPATRRGPSEAKAKNRETGESVERGVSAGAEQRALVHREVASPSSRPSRRRRGPLTFEVARSEAEEALDRDALLDLCFAFSRQFFDYTAFFLVQADIAEGRDAFGSGACRERVLGIGVPLDLPSLLANARERRAPIVTTAPAEGLDAVLLADLERPPNSEVAVVPLVVRTRAVALLVGDCGEAGVDRQGVNEVAAFCAVIGKAFERIIVRRKLEGFIAGSRAGMPGRIDPSTVRDERENQQVLPPDERLSWRPASSSPPSRAPSESPLAGALNSSVPPPPPVNITTIRPIGGPPIPREDPPDEPPALMSQERLAAPALPVFPPESPAPAVEIVRSFEPPPTTFLGPVARPSLRAVDTAQSPPPSADSASAIAVSAHRPPVPQSDSEDGLPLVIVDFDAELRSMVDRLLAGDHDEAAEIELLRQGERAMPVLMERFPGPVTFDRSLLATQANPPSASECGVLLRLVARERKVALPHVLDHLSDPDPEKRGWATHLLCELAYVEALPRLLERIRDEDAAIRASAGQALVALSRSYPGRVAQSLLELAEESDTRARGAAMKAIGHVRLASLVPVLVHGLGDGSESVVAAAHAALVQVTRQDFGTDARPWMRWWEANSTRHRMEWLIDSLTHEVSEIRRVAAEELRNLSRQYFGFSSEIPRRDRERAQQRYRDWWITEGRSRHRRS